MFLFTTPKPTESLPALPHAQSLKRASERTGISFDYLAKTAERESRFDATARAPTSTATGLFQFLDQTWLQMMRTEAPNLGRPELAQMIQPGRDGRLTVADPGLREQILKLRENPDAAALMAGLFAKRNGESLEQAVGRKPTDGELYVAHFLGAGGARELIGLKGSEPQAIAARRFPEAAAANRSVFFARDGRALTVSEVFDGLTRTFDQAGAQRTVPTLPDGQALPGAGYLRQARDSAPLHGLFRTGNEPVAAAVQREWSRLPRPTEGAQRVAFFPRGERASAPVMSDASPPALLSAPEAVRVTVPLPPGRPQAATPAPDGQGAPRRAARPDSAEIAAPPQGRARSVAARQAQPLDLLAFMRGTVRP
jgi:hypothetical protein